MRFGLGVASPRLYAHIARWFLQQVELPPSTEGTNRTRDEMKRRDLLRSLGAVGAVTAAGHVVDPVVAGGQSFPNVSGRSITDTLASRLLASIQKHKVPGASAAVFRGGQWEVAAAGVTNVTTGVDVTAETVMHIGSITKVLTATLVMQLVDVRPGRAGGAAQAVSP